MQHDKILILDFGSQVTQLIARRVREAHVYCEVHPCDVSDEWVRQYASDGKLRGVILSGSHASVYEDSTDRAPQQVFELGVFVGKFSMHAMAGGKSQQVAAEVRDRKTRQVFDGAVQILKRLAGNTAKKVDRDILNSCFKNGLKRSKSSISGMHAAETQK